MQGRKTGIHLAILLGDAVIVMLSAAVLYVLISRNRGAELLGQYSLVLSWMTVFQAVGYSGIPELLIRELGAHFDDQNRYMTHGLVAGLLVSGVANILLAVLVGFLPYGPEVEQALLLVTLSLMPATLFSICRGAFLVVRRTEWVFLIGVVECVTVVVINSYSIMHGKGIVPLVLTMVAGKLLASLVAFFLLIRYTIKLDWRLDRRLFRQMMAPIFAFAASNWLSLLGKRVNVVMLSMMTTFSAVGLYSAANAFAEMSFVIPILVAQLVLPQLSRSFGTNNPDGMAYYERMIALMFALTVPVGLGISYFAGSVIAVAFGAAFGGSAPVLRILMLIFIIESADSLMSILLKSAGHQKADVLLFTANPAVNIALNFITIPLLGGVGAAVSKGMAVLCSWSVHCLFISKKRIGVDWLRVGGKPVLAGALIIGVLALLGDHIPVGVRMGLYALLSGVAFFRISGFAVDELRDLSVGGRRADATRHPGENDQQ